MSGKSRAAKRAAKGLVGVAKRLDPVLRETEEVVARHADDAVRSASRHADDAARSATRHADDAVRSATRHADDAARQVPTPPRGMPQGGTPPSGNGPLNPRGRRSAASRRADQTMHRALQAENTSADAMARHGYDVHQNPADTPGFRQSPEFQRLSPEDQASFVRGKEPDFIIEGKVFDQYSPSAANPDWIAHGIERKVVKGQTTRVVLNLDASPVTGQQLRQHLVSNPIAGLKELIVVRGGELEWLFP